MKKISFAKAVYNLKELPKIELPTIVLCGRSNVGKSTFINCLFSPQKVAKTSSTPGKTRSINYYLVDNKFYIVDLPGFGYAKVSKKERDYWQNIIESFFRFNKNIISAFHIIDSRHEPTELDFQFNRYLKENKLNYIIVLNKADKLKQSEIVSAKRNIHKYFPEMKIGVDVFLSSSIKGTGINEINSLMESLLL